MHSRAPVVLVVSIAAGLLAGCFGDDSSTESEGLPQLEDDRIIRVLGNDTGRSMSGTERAPDTNLNRPTYITPGPDGTLVGMQSDPPVPFTLEPDGTATALQNENNDLALHGHPLAAVVRDTHLFVLTSAADGARFATVDLPDGTVEDVILLDTMEIDYTPTMERATLLDLPDGLYLQWHEHWWRMDENADGQPALADPIPAPVPDTLVSARTTDGVLALTETELIQLDESLGVINRHPWQLPDGRDGDVVTSIVSDGHGGAYATSIGQQDSPRQGTGAVLHITPETVTVLAFRGSPPEDGEYGCDDADVAAQDAMLLAPASLAVWEERLMVADYGCHSILQLPLPTADDDG
ncbi:hypothetical protein [Phytoactinopolyspora mesophila]|uniref:Uncharacterized protein n=1 Tax=Phytoactinopolyspora mesophila TaxID=2650750 RepID=A0A7K3M9D5_9ACTN|nr:hypothetical protein [Phytoactinopolyspora mesophila]NDL59935.1 hypothetical protein [Phytoactinopolyspora mesophila]